MADFETQFQCKNGQQVVIVIDDDPCKATAYTLDGQEIGAMEFYEVELP